MADDSFYTTSRMRLSPRSEPGPREVLFEFVREADHTHFQCEVAYSDNWYGVEAILLKNGEPFFSRLLDSRIQAARWAKSKREHIAKGRA